jgi:homeobox protein cut-like
LQDLQKTLDAQGIEIVDNQKESVLGRKQLADRTKGSSSYITSVILSGSELLVEFKKIPDDEKLNSFKGLLKCLHSPLNLNVLEIANFWHSIPDRNR